MSSIKVTEQIKELVDSDQVDTKSAVVLLLSAHGEMIEQQEKVMQRLDKIFEILKNQEARIETRLQQQEVDIHAKINAIDERVADLEEYNKLNPPILWLFRFRTKETVAVIILLFVLLSLWWVSGFRQPLLQLLGLPPF